MASLSSRTLSRLSSQRVAAIRQLNRSLSSQPPRNVEEEDGFKHAQEFVKMKFEPGEWDPNRNDPLFKPPFKSRAKIMSAEDYAERPRVGFEEEFDSLRDAMVTLTWLDGNDCDKIYGAYIELMSKQSSVTSHEYVMRVLAQKFKLTAQRVAAICELAHREDQQRKAGKKIYYDAQDYVDKRAREHIEKAYSEYGETAPEQFVEDPMGVTGIVDLEATSGSTVAVEDMLDVDSLMKAVLIREQADARLKIDGHIYREDVDEKLHNVKLSKETQKLMETKKSYHATDDLSERRGELKPMPGDEQPRRSRWKYAAHTVNTRDAKKNKKSIWRKNREIAKDILVEQDGDLRVATVSEVKATSWKPVRNFQEFTYTSLKAAWLERTLRGETGGWGRQEAPEPPAEEVAELEASDGEESESDEQGDDAESEDEVSEEVSEKESNEEEPAAEDGESAKADGDDKKE